MSDHSHTQFKKAGGPGKHESYIFGFILSLFLTLIAFFLVYASLMSGWAMVFTLGVLAFAQVVVQLVFFLHLGEEPSPPWNLIVFLFMVLIVLIVVIGTIWIMYHLDYQMIPSTEHLQTHKELQK